MKDEISKRKFTGLFSLQKTVHSLNNIKFLFQKGGDCNATCNET